MEHKALYRVPTGYERDYVEKNKALFTEYHVIRISRRRTYSIVIALLLYSIAFFAINAGLGAETANTVLYCSPILVAAIVIINRLDGIIETGREIAGKIDRGEYSVRDITIAIQKSNCPAVLASGFAVAVKSPRGNMDEVLSFITKCDTNPQPEGD